MKFFWNYSDTLFPFLVLLLLLSTKRKLAEGHSMLLFYLLFTALLMGLSNILADRHIHNMYLYHLYALAEVWILIPLIALYSPWNKPLVTAVLLCFSLYWFVNILYFEPFQKFNSNSAAIAALLISLFCFRYFLLLTKTDDILYFQKKPSFWIVSGFLFYSIAAVLVLGSYKYKEWFTDIDTHITWRIQQVANIIKFVLISIGVLCCYRPTSQDGLSSSEQHP